MLALKVTPKEEQEGSKPGTHWHILCSAHSVGVSVPSSKSTNDLYPFILRPLYGGVS